MEFKTIKDMEKAYYTEPLKRYAEAEGLGVDELITKTKEEIFERGLMKADSPYLTNTTGVVNTVYGAEVWSWICTDANAFGLLPKIPYKQGGFRAITAAASTASAGIAEGGAVPDSIKPTLAQIKFNLKTLGATTDQSEIVKIMEGNDDVAAWGELIGYAKLEFLNRANRGLLTENGTLASTNFESIDRVVGSKSEIDNCEGVGGAYSTNDLDIYNLDRDDVTTHDAYVNHNSNTDRVFALEQLDDVIDGCAPYWRSKKNKVILTGYDTARLITQLERPKEVYAPDQKIQFTVNGVQSAKGKEAGIPVASFDGIPIVISNNVPKDTISRVYVLDLDNLFLTVGRPVSYIESQDPFVVGYKRKGNFSMVGELVCTNFRAQGKIRDLKGS